MMPSKRFAAGWIAVCLSFMACGPVLAQFVHPGCLSTQADLDRMEAKVAAGAQPWKSGYDRLTSAPYGQLGHTPNPQVTLYASGSQPDNYITVARDAAAAYQVALRYHVTGDPAYAAKAVSILMAWANTHTGWNGNTNVSLRAGLYGYQLACAGELVRGYSGWDPVDFAKFQNYVRTQFYKIVSPNDVDRGFLFHHHGTCSSHYWANWELAAMATVIATGVLCDDETIFQEAIDYFYDGVGVGRISELLYYLHPNGLGQSQEFGRDQGHATILVPLLGTFCEIAWNQGIDLYSELDNAFLAMGENIAKHNLYYDVPYVSYVNCEYDYQTNIGGGQGQMRAGWDLIYNHYVNRKGMSAPYSKEAAEQMRPDGGGGQYGGNSGGFDQLGFTTLTHSLDPIASGVVPSQLRAHVKGGKITLSWRGSAYAKSYNVKRATAPGGPYLILATVDAKNTCHVDAGVPPGTSCHYVVSANNPAGESANSAEVSAAHDGQLHGTIIGTDGAWNNGPARKEHLFDGSLKNFFDGPTSICWGGLDLGEGVSAVVTEVKYCPRGGMGGRMVGGKFQGSNTADFSSGVIDLFTIASAPPSGVLTTQAINNGTSFRYLRYLCSANGFGNAAEVQFIGNVTGMAPPASAPGGLAISSPGFGQAALAWDAVPGATGYIVKRATTSGGPYTIVDSPVWSTGYTERGLPAGTYYYVVSALNSVGETANSSEQSIPVLVNVTPGSATSAHAGSGSGTEGSDKAIDGNTGTKWFTGGGSASGWLQIDLGAGNAQTVVRCDLTSANDVPNRDPKNWQVQGSNDATNWTTLDTRTGEVFATRFLTKQYTFTNSTAYRYYKLNILSNFSGNSADGIQLSEWSLISQGSGLPPSPSDTVPPSAPAGVVATAEAQVVTLDWADNTEPDIARYAVYRSATGGGPYDAIATGLTFSSYSDTTVTNGTTYHYVVTASDTSLNESTNSAEAAGTPQAPPPPDAPAGLVATVVSNTRIDLAWNAANGAASYIVRRSTTSGGPYVTLATNVTTTGYSDLSAVPRTPYYYVVKGVNIVGEGDDSVEASVMIDDLHLHLKCDEINGATATDSSGNGRNATLANGSSFASGRIDNALVFSGSSSQHATLPTGVVSALGDFTISTWVKPASLDNWARVFDFGSGTATNMFLSPKNGANGKPRFAIKISNSAEQLIDGPDALATGVWTHIAITLSGATGTLYINGVAAGTNAAMTFKPSGMGSTTQNYLGKSQYSDPYFNGAIDDFRIYSSALGGGEIAVLAAGPLAAPQNVNAAAGAGQIALSWNAVAGATSYTVQRSANGSGPYTDLATGITDSGYLDASLAAGTTWHYTVAATGLPGAGPASSPVSATAYTALQSWRFTHFGTTSNSGAAADDADPDGDGWNNANEFAAGTGPNDRTSLLGITGFEFTGQDVTIAFPTVSGKSYRVEKSATLLDGSWLTVAWPVSGTGAAVEITDPGARTQPRWFYRIAVLPD
jgi:hypothetical protein